MTVANPVTEVNLNETFPDCDISSNIHYDTIVSALCVVMGLFGLVYTFVGYRCFKAVMFLSGLIFGGTVVFVMCHEERILQHALSLEATIGISVGIGFMCGFVTMLVKYFGLFLQGFFLGLLTALAAITTLQKFYHPSTPWIPVGILFGSGILFSLFTLKWQKTFVIISTAVMGSALICTCLDYFLEKFLLLRYIWEALMAATSVNVCWYTWLVLGIWPTLSVAGCVIQWKFTGKGYDHTDIIIRRGRQKRVRTHLVRPHREQAHSSDGTTQDSSRTRRSERMRNRPRAAADPFPPLHDDIPPTSIAMDNANYDTLPPSYDDCVKNAVGEPITERDRDRIVRTQHGSFLAPRQGASNAATTTSPPSNSDEPPTDGFVPGARAQAYSHASRPPSRDSSRPRNGAQRGSGRQAGRRNRQNQAPRRDNESTERQSGRRARPARGSFRNSGESNTSIAVDDTRLLLSGRNRAAHPRAAHGRQNRPTVDETMSAHARRLRAMQDRRGNNI